MRLAAAILLISTATTASATVYSLPGSTATVTPGAYAAVTTDLFDVNQGLTVISDSGYSYAGAGPTNMFGGLGGVYGDANNTLFRDGSPGGTVHFAIFSLPSPVTVGSIKMGFSQDGSAITRGAAGYSLLGLQSPTDPGLVLSQATFADDYIAAYGDGNIAVEDTFPAFTGSYFRFNVVQRSDTFGPRVQELDGFAAAVPEPSAAALALVGAAAACVIARRRNR
jgi:hypothetical protein